MQVLDEVRPMTLSGDDDPGYDPQAAFHRAAADDADDTIEMTDAIKPRRHSKRGAGEQQQKTSTAVADAPTAAAADDAASKDAGEEEVDPDEEEEEDEPEEEDEETKAMYWRKVEKKARCPPCKTKRASSTI